MYGRTIKLFDIADWIPKNAEQKTGHCDSCKHYRDGRFDTECEECFIDLDGHGKYEGKETE